MSWVFFENVSSDEKNLRMDDKKTSFFGGGGEKKWPYLTTQPVLR